MITLDHAGLFLYKTSPVRKDTVYNPFSQTRFFVNPRFVNNDCNTCIGVLPVTLSHCIEWIFQDTSQPFVVVLLVYAAFSRGMHRFAH